LLISQPLDTLLHHYGKVTNLIARAEKIDSPSVDHMTSLFAEINKIKGDLEDWKKELPLYYEAISMPLTEIEKSDPNNILYMYPYNERLDYLTGMNHAGTYWLSGPGFIGHTMNMYRAIILQIDRYLLGHVWPDKAPSEGEIKYHIRSYKANNRLAKEIVMSLPGLNTTGGIFVLYPSMRASKVLGREEKLYIVRMLNKVAHEVPVARPLAMHIMEFEHEIPSENCRSVLSKQIWEINATNLGTMGSG
jgi:hypothetical protein